MGNDNKTSLFLLKGRVILIAGGYGLLGRQFAKTLADAGANVVIGGRSLEKARQLADKIDGFAVALDVSVKDSVFNAVQEIIQQYGRIDGLINNASFSSPEEKKNGNYTPLEDLDEAVWNHSLNVDLTGMFFCAQAVGKVMAENNGGVIVNVSSIYGICSPDPQIYDSLFNDRGEKFIKSIGYCVSKSGVLGLTRYLAVYWKDKNIRVNTITLGGVYDGQEESFVNAYAEKTPLGRMAKQDEYNGAILFLLSDASSYMTGSNLVIDGGWSVW